jgi:hypothetical protein
MIGVTFFGLFLTPVFYTVIRKLSGDKPIIAPGNNRETPDRAAALTQSSNGIDSNHDSEMVGDELPVI